MHKIAKLAHKIEQLDICVRRLALLELSCWAFLLGPVVIDEGESMPGRLDLLLGRSEIPAGHVPAANGGSALQSVAGWKTWAGCERVDRSLLEGELIAVRAREAGLQAKHKGILIESCREWQHSHSA